MVNLGKPFSPCPLYSRKVMRKSLSGFGTNVPALLQRRFLQLQMGSSAWFWRLMPSVLQHCSCHVLSRLESLSNSTSRLLAPSPTALGDVEVLSPPARPWPRCPRFWRSRANAQVREMPTQAWYLKVPFRHQLLFVHGLCPSCAQEHPSYLRTSLGTMSPARVSSGTFGLGIVSFKKSLQSS